MQQPAPENIQDTAVIGVVIAGVLVSFTIPGPFDWGSTLIGTILLAVLVAYGAKPWALEDWRRAIGMSAAAAFCLLQLIARPLDLVIVRDAEGVQRHLLSWWPYPSIMRDEEVPDPTAGWQLAVAWLILFLACMLAWWLTHQRSKPSGGAGDEIPAQAEQQ